MLPLSPLAASLALTLLSGPEGDRLPFAHVQTDRPAYRLGETLWFRVHESRGEGSPGEVPGTLSVVLIDPDGDEAARRDLGPAAPPRVRDARKLPRLLSGKLFLPQTLTPGLYRLQARAGGTALHSVPLRICDAVKPGADLRLTVLGRKHYPGGTVTASFQALDWKGRPIAGKPVEYRATHGPVVVRGTAKPTDDEGRSLIRFVLPRSVRDSGHLSAGISLKRSTAAVAQPLDVSASVARIDAFPEGGSIVAGCPQKLALLVRGLNGLPAPAQGRVLDDLGRLAEEFEADDRGLASVLVPCEKDRSYHLIIDRPEGVTRQFPLPGPTGHAYALAVTRTAEGFQVEVSGTEETAEKQVRLILARGTTELKTCHAVLSRVPGGRTARTRIEFRDVRSEGLGHLILEAGGRAILKRPIFLGPGSPVEVSLKPITGTLLPGRPADFEVIAQRGGLPVQADLSLSVFEGAASLLPDLPERLAVEPALGGRAVPEKDILEDRGRLDTYLLFSDAFAFPAEGVPLEPAGLPEPLAGRVVLPECPPAPPARDEDAPEALEENPRGRTRVEATRDEAIEQALLRAPFTILEAPKDEDDSWARVDLEAAQRSRGIARPARVPPQMVELPPGRVDARRTLCWADRIRTDAFGRATVSFKLNHLVTDLQWSAQGFAGALPATGRGALSRSPAFRTRFNCPEHLQVGDVFDLMLHVDIPDCGESPLEIEVEPPPCLKPLLRTRLRMDPRNDPRVHRFRFCALAAAESAELRVTSTRGLFQEAHRRRFQVAHRELELAFGRTGRDLGLQSFTLKIPEDAIPGTVRLQAIVAPDPILKIFDDLPAILRQPVGCFEQFTSTNYVNLVILDTLRDRTEDPLVLEKAFGYARQGLERLLSHRDEATGGFTLWQGNQAGVLPTVVAVRHLALYSRIFEGLCRKELGQAVRWLETQKVGDRELLHVTLALHEEGRTWKGSEAAWKIHPRDLYTAALQAACVAAWPGEAPPQARENLEKRLDELEAALATRWVTSAGMTGITGSTGDFLSTEIIALAAVALERGGRTGSAESCALDLSTRGRESLGSLGTALAVRAFRVLQAPRPGETLDVEFKAKPGGSRRVVTSPDRQRAIAFESEADVRPGDSTTVAVDIRSEAPKPYHLTCSYRTAAPRPSPRAAFGVETRLPDSVDLDQTTSLALVISPLAKTASSQVVARIALPAGLQVETEEMQSLEKQVSFWEVKDGYLNLYWSSPIRRPLGISIPLRARVAGIFTARPSVVYPYYEAGKEGYAPPLHIKVNNTGGLDPDAVPPGWLRGHPGSPAGPGGPPGAGSPPGPGSLR